MNEIVQLVVLHGYSILFAAVFARQIGLPVPANLFILAAGALAAGGRLDVVPAILLAVVACVIADWCWYEAGRLAGDRVLHFIHQFAPDPDSADRRAKKHFARYGPPILILAKFIPGLDLVAPPMAGTSRTSRMHFLALETTGAALWAVANAALGWASARAALGYVSSHDLNSAVSYAHRAGALIAALGVFVFFVYVGFRMHCRLSPKHKGSPLNIVSEETAEMREPRRLLESSHHGD